MLPTGPIKTLRKDVIEVAKTEDGKVLIEYDGKFATVVQPNIIADNGIIHIIDNIFE